MSPKGDFFTQRILQDDLRGAMTTPGTQLDVVLMIIRITEVFAVGLAIAKAAGWGPTDVAGFRFQWSGLAGRSLGAWAKPFEWETGAHGTAHDQHADSFVRVTLDTAVDALQPYVSSAVAPIFVTFDGYVPAAKLVESCIRLLLDRKV